VIGRIKKSLEIDYPRSKTTGYSANFIKVLRWIPPSSLGGGKRRFAEGESACCSY